MQDPKKADEMNLELLYEDTCDALHKLTARYERLLAAAKEVVHSSCENRYSWPSGGDAVCHKRLLALTDAIREAEGEKLNPLKEDEDAEDHDGVQAGPEDGAGH